MRAFDGLYVSKIYYMRRDGKFSAHGVGKPGSSIFLANDETIVAFMAPISRNPNRHEVRRGRVVPLSKVLSANSRKVIDNVV